MNTSCNEQKHSIKTVDEQISIAIPTYNRPELLKNAINSVLNQTYQNFELILSNNCSTDPLVEQICKEYASSNQRIKYFCQSENIGCTNNIMFCISKVKNKIYFLMSDDDIIDSTYIEKCVLKLKTENGSIACSTKFKYIDEERNKIDCRLVSNADCKSNNPIDNIIKWTMCSHWSAAGLWNINITEKCDFNYKKTFANDVLLFSQFMLHGKIPRVEEELYTYQLRMKTIDPKIISETNNDYNEYSLISLYLDLIMRTFELVFESDKLSIVQKIEFYFKMWSNLIRTKHWLDKLKAAPAIKFTELLIKENKFADIIFMLPCVIYSQIRHMRFLLANCNNVFKKVRENSILIVNYDNSNGEKLLEYANHIVNKGYNVDILSSKSYKNTFKLCKNINVIKIKNYVSYLQLNKIAKYKFIVFTKQDNGYYQFGFKNKILFMDKILNNEEKI